MKRFNWNVLKNDIVAWYFFALTQLIMVLANKLILKIKKLKLDKQ